MVEMCYKMKHMSENSSSVNIMKLTLILLTWRIGELLIIAANGRWDLIQCLKG